MVGDPVSNAASLRAMTFWHSNFDGGGCVRDAGSLMKKGMMRERGEKPRYHHCAHKDAWPALNTKAVLPMSDDCLQSLLTR